jgi:hypothetical protein
VEVVGSPHRRRRRSASRSSPAGIARAATGKRRADRGQDELHRAAGERRGRLGPRRLRRDAQVLRLHAGGVDRAATAQPAGSRWHRACGTSCWFRNAIRAAGRRAEELPCSSATMSSPARPEGAGHERSRRRRSTRTSSEPRRATLERIDLRAPRSRRRPGRPAAGGGSSHRPGGTSKPSVGAFTAIPSRPALVVAGLHSPAVTRWRDGRHARRAQDRRRQQLLDDQVDALAPPARRRPRCCRSARRALRDAGCGRGRQPRATRGDGRRRREQIAQSSRMPVSWLE